MKTFTYTHHQGGEGKLTQVQLPHEERPDYIFKPDVFDTLGFSPSDNGKTFGEGEFEVKKQVITVKSGWIDTDDFTYDDVPESQRRIIAVPLSEKREERTQDELEDERILNDAKIDAMVLDWLDSTKEQWATMSIKDLLVGFYKYLLTLNKQ